MATGSWRSLADISRALAARRLLPCSSDLSPRIAAAFHLEEGSLSATVKGGRLLLASDSETVRFALRGAEGELLRWLHRQGYTGVRRVTWSAG